MTCTGWIDDDCDPHARLGHNLDPYGLPFVMTTTFGSRQVVCPHSKLVACFRSGSYACR